MLTEGKELMHDASLDAALACVLISDDLWNIRIDQTPPYRVAPLTSEL